MINSRPYQPEDAEVWDEVVRTSRNGTLLFYRNFMDYHKDRFQDASLLFFDGKQAVGCLPMSRHGRMLNSHGGLTFGGLISLPEMRFAHIEAMIEETLKFARETNCERIVYKPTPYIYHRCPSQEDVFCLSRRGATISRTDLNTVVDLKGMQPVQERRLRGAKNAAKAGVVLEFHSSRYEEYWKLLEATLLDRHGLTPVHSCQEALLLKSRFPEQISLHVATLDNEVIAGVLTFDSGLTVHAQYIAANSRGRDSHSLDFLFLNLLKSLDHPCRYFSFGISTFDEGRQLNRGLLEQKEGFGGRTLIQDWYELRI